MKKINRRVKGFTLTEMVIVLAIIGVLAGILAPTMSAYYRKSRISAANSNARMVYNAAQTAAQKYISMDRTATTASPLKTGSHVLLVSYANNVVSHADAFGAAYTSEGRDKENDSVYWDIANAVNATVSGGDQISWTVCIQNYIVKGSVAADTVSSYYVGYYSAGKTCASERSQTFYSNWLGNDVNSGDSTNSSINTIEEICDNYH